MAVKANQELILRLTWMNEEARESAYLVTREYTADEMASKSKILTPPLPVLPKIKLPSGELTDGKIAKVMSSFVSSVLENDSVTCSCFSTCYCGTLVLHTLDSSYNLRGLVFIFSFIFLFVNAGYLARGIHRQRSARAPLEKLVASARALVVERQLDSRQFLWRALLVSYCTLWRWRVRHSSL